MTQNTQRLLLLLFVLAVFAGCAIVLLVIWRVTADPDLLR